MANPLRNQTGEALNLQGSRAASITPHDTNDLSITPATVYVGGDGNMAVTTAGGDDVTFVGLVAGTILPVLCTKVKSTGTTATNLIALR